MIPVSLTLRNFLSYGEDAPTLDFTDFRIACVTGLNGHGKSALFDAITWALWGEARKASSDRKPDEGLLRIGATDVRVDFEFDLDGQRFRVTRAFRKTARSGASTLELQVYDASSDRYRAISESGSIRKTQARIDRLVRIGYDTFVNSAFILQGRVDEFTRRSPSDRKAILGEILELSRYDALSARAREHARAAEAKVARMRDHLTRIEEAAVRRHDIRERLAEASDTLEAAEASCAVAEQDLARCGADIASAEAALARLAALRSEIDANRSRLAEVEADLAATRAEADAFERTLENRDRIVADVAALERLRTEEAAHRKKENESQALALERARLGKALEAARLKVEALRDRWAGVVSDLYDRIREGEAALADRASIREQLSGLADARKEETDLLALRREADQLAAERRELESAFNRERSEIQVEIETRRTRRAALQADLDRRTGLERAFNDARQHHETYLALNDEMEGVKRDGTEAQRTEERLEGRLEELDRRRQQVLAQVEQIDASADGGDCPLCGTTLEPGHREDVLSQLRKEAEELDWEHRAATRGLADARSRRDACRTAYQKLRDRAHPLADAPRRFARAEADLGQVSGVDESLETVVRDIQALENRAKAFETDSETARQLGAARDRTRTLEKRLKRLDEVRREIERFAPAELENARLNEVERSVDAARERLPEAEKALSAAVEQIDSEAYAADLRPEIEDIDRRLAEAAYDGDAHGVVLDRIEALAGVEAEREGLREAEQTLAVVRTRIASAEARRAEIAEALGVAESAAAEIGDPAADRDRLEGSRRESADRLTACRETRDDALREVAALERDDAACAELEAELPEVRDRLARAEKSVTVDRELARAFGRDGIQALLIDQAIPELQDEANRILARLTENGTQVALESLSELKGGGTRETLDIRISDELGERRYELYSGGEAFRVDFALRIALSKLLASRSGTPLQTLVIDEGFGTQDEHGLSQLIEAIQAISDEFEKVLVITHVDAIKSAFPVRIEVVKHPESGSTFTVTS